MNGGLKIADIQDGATCVVVLEGRIDSSSAEQLAAHLKGLLSGGSKSVLVDLKGVPYLTSAAFRSLLIATDEAERLDAEFCLCHIHGYVRELFELGGLLDAFTIWETREQALAKKRA